MSEPAHVKRLGRAITALQHLEDPLRRLDATRQAREAVERLERQSVTDSRNAGRTWTEIGALYGLTKQGAQQRFKRAAHHHDPTPPPSLDR